MLWYDGNANGLPDSWELSHFGSLNQTANGDYDHDGVSNYQEFLDGTDPANATSTLYHIALTTDGGTVVAVPDQPGYTNSQVVTLTAIGSNGFPFHAWTGDVLSRSNVLTLTMTTNMTLFVHFQPLSFDWVSPTDGDWNVAANWTPNLVPGSNDSVRIIGQIAVTLNTAADLADFTLYNLYGGSPTLTGAGTLTVHGACNWLSGTMSGSGRMVIAPGASLNLASPPSASVLTLARTLENAGSAFWTGPAILNLSGVITNDPGGVFVAANAPSVNFVGGTPRFDNAGTFRAVTSGTLAFFNVAFNNYGVTEIQSGTLYLTGGGLNVGTVDVPAGATLNLGSGNFTASAASSIAGAGQFIVSSANGTLAGLVNVSSTNTFSGGTVNFTGNYIGTNNTLVISGGSASFNGTGLLAPAVLNLSNGALGGAQTVTVLNTLNWTGGNMNDPGRTVIPPGATLNLANPSYVTMTSRTLENGGAATWTGAGVLSMTLNGAVITNRPGALFDVQNAAGFNFGGGVPRFDNAGTFRRSANPGTTSFNNVAFNNYGAAQIQFGTLYLNGGGLNNGTVDVPAGTTLSLGGGTFTSSAASSIAGAGQFIVGGANGTLAGLVNVSGTNTFSAGAINLTGNYFCTNNTLVISGGTATFNGTGAVSPAVLTLSSGTLGGAQTVTALNTMSWTGGNMADTGRTVIPANATLNFANPAFVTITSRTLENGGAATWRGTAPLTLNGAVITNRPGALFDVQNAAGFNFGGGVPRFDNAGTFRRSANPGTTSFNNVAFINYGLVDLQSGFLAMNSSYASFSNSILNCLVAGIVPGIDFGQLQVSGSVTLNGTIRLNLGSNYIPTANDSFTLVTAGACSGAFSNFIYPSNQVAMVLSNTPTSVSVLATSILALPRPVLLPPLLSSSNLILSWTSLSNGVYRLQYTPDFSQSNWSEVKGDVTAVSNTASKADILTSTNRYYRVLGLHP